MGLNTDQRRKQAAKTPAPGLYETDASSDPSTDSGADPDGHTLIDGVTVSSKTGELQTDVGKGSHSPDADLPAGPLALQRALREVEASVDTELVETLEKLESLRKKEEALQEQLEHLYLELGNIQDALQETSADMKKSLQLRANVYSRRYETQATALQRTLLTDAADLRERERLWKSRLEEAEARLRAFKENPELAAQLEEFRRLDERMDTLELLPESYRGVVQNHHTDLQKKLKPHLEEPVYEEHVQLRLAVAVAVTGGRRPGSSPQDEPDAPGRLLAVLPVDFKTHARARQGKSDLTARFAFRVLAALSRFVVNIGARSDPKPIDLDGLLGIELPFDDLDIPVAAVDLARALRESFAEATDTQMAKVGVSTDMVFVAMGSLEVLWARCEESKTGAKPTPARGKSKQRGRGK